MYMSLESGCSWRGCFTVFRVLQCFTVLHYVMLCSYYIIVYYIKLYYIILHYVGHPSIISEGEVGWLLNPAV